MGWKSATIVNILSSKTISNSASSEEETENPYTWSILSLYPNEWFWNDNSKPLALYKPNHKFHIDRHARQNVASDGPLDWTFRQS